MKICAMCGKKVTIDEYLKRTSSCPHCGEDLHICLNCRHYSESSRHWCLEPRVELPRARDKANFCDFFRYRDGGQKPSGASESRTDDVRKNFEDLFNK